LERKTRGAPLDEAGLFAGAPWITALLALGLRGKSFKVKR